MIENQVKDIQIKKTSVEDLENLATLWNDGDVMRFVGYPEGLGVTIGQLQKWHKSIEESELSEHYSIYHKELGYCGESFYSVIKGQDLSMLDIKLFSKARGKGIGRYALEYAIVNAFKTTSCSRVYVDPCRENVDAWRLYEKLGFVEAKRPEFLEPSEIYLELTKENFNPIF